jgi:hypothetical protein
MADSRCQMVDKEKYLHNCYLQSAISERSEVK